MKRFLESGGVYAKYKVTPAFEEVVKSMWKKQRAAEAAHRAEQERIKDEERRRLKLERESKPVEVTDRRGQKIDIDNIIEELKSNVPEDGVSEGTHLSSQKGSELYLYGQDVIPQDDKPYRTLSSVKEFDM